MQRDKKLHAAASFLITGISYLATKNGAIAVSMGLGVGLLKEVFDYYTGGVASYGDITANLVGVCSAVIVIGAYAGLKECET